MNVNVVILLLRHMTKDKRVREYGRVCSVRVCKEYQKSPHILYNIYIPGTQMTLVFIGNGRVLEG